MLLDASDATAAVPVSLTVTLRLISLEVAGMVLPSIHLFMSSCPIMEGWMPPSSP